MSRSYKSSYRPCQDLINQVIDAYHHATALTGAHSRVCPPGETAKPGVGCAIVLPNSNEVSHPGKGTSSGPSVSHPGRH